MMVPPPASMPEILSRIWPLLDAACTSTTQNRSASKAITPTLSFGPSSSTAALAASLAISILTPPIDPDLSMTSTIARLGFSFSFSKSLRTGRISSSTDL